MASHTSLTILKQLEDLSKITTQVLHQNTVLTSQMNILANRIDAMSAQIQFLEQQSRSPTPTSSPSSRSTHSTMSKTPSDSFLRNWCE